MLGLVYSQPPNYFRKEKREEAHCVRGTKGTPRGLIKMSHPQRKHTELTQRHRSVDDLVWKEVIQ